MNLIDKIEEILSLRRKELEKLYYETFTGFSQYDIKPKMITMQAALIVHYIEQHS